MHCMHISAISVDPQIFALIHNSTQVPISPFLLFAIYVRLCAMFQCPGLHKLPLPDVVLDPKVQTWQRMRLAPDVRFDTHGG